MLPDGDFGELVLTTLTKEAMPVVRYRTRDLTRLLPGTARTDAADGEGHRPVRTNMLIVRGVNLFPTQIEEHLLGSEVLTGHYLIVLTRQGRMDEVMVQVEHHPHVTDYDRLHAEALTVARRIKDTVGLTVRISVERPGTIERSIGKARRVLDQRGIA